MYVQNFFKLSVASAQDRQTWRQRVALCIEDAG